MSKRETNTYSPEFKESAIKLELESDRPVAETAEERKYLLKGGTR